MKKVLKKKVLQYTAVFEPVKEGGYVVSIPSLPGCYTQGDTFEESLENIKEATSLYLEVMQKMKEELPKEEGVIVAPIKVKV
jgi:predicted RNase H-like HicB family nuclease